MIPSIWKLSNLDSGSIFVIPVTMPIGGIIIIGETTITYYLNNNAFQSVVIDKTVICAWNTIDENGSRYLLGDTRGNLYVLILLIDNNQVVSIAIDYLGRTNMSQTINYLDNGIVFIGSAVGDSQLIKLHSNKTINNESYLEILDNYNNIGPITDLTIINDEKTDQTLSSSSTSTRIVTCSGAYQNGSLNVIRNVIGITEQASIELQGLKDLFSIKLSENDIYDKLLIQSYISETRILAIENDEMSEVSYCFKNNC